MPRGRHPEGEHTLSNAERQARYRARREADQPAPVVRYRRPVDRRSRLQRWHDAVAGLLALQDEYAAWCDALPDSLRDSATAVALQAIVDLDLDELTAIVPPRVRSRLITTSRYPPRSVEKFGELRLCRLTNTREE
jgi:hypothetical protein